MAWHRKLPPEQLLEAIKRSKAKKRSVSGIAREYGIDQSYLRACIARYEAHGKKAFIKKQSSTKYSNAKKEKIVQAYLNGEGTYIELAAKYGISTKSLIQTWVKEYIENQGPGYKLPEAYIKNRKALKPIEEREKIATECIESGYNYSITAQKYEVPYHRVYAWVREYKKKHGIT